LKRVAEAHEQLAMAERNATDPALRAGVALFQGDTLEAEGHPADALAFYKAHLPEVTEGWLKREFTNRINALEKPVEK
jgi:hypothetical protein